MKVHRNAKLPRFSSVTAKSKYKNISNKTSLDNKVAIFTTCYHNFNEPNVIDDLVKVLKHNNVSVELIKDDKCCGMPKLELGDLKTVEKMMDNFLCCIDARAATIAKLKIIHFQKKIPLTRKIITCVKSYINVNKSIHLIRNTAKIASN